jgi:RNA polymerase sigma-70 factor (ECF subfamily)
MAESSQPAPVLTALMADLYHQSKAEEFGIDGAAFAGMLTEIATKYLPSGAQAPETDRLFESLRVEELVLARACAGGNEKAWEIFLTRYRTRLYEMAGAIAREDSRARELADSIYAELYGLSARGDRRVSKLSYYMGRGSLEGWLRTVLAQAYVDRYRSQKRLVSLEEQEEQGSQFPAASPDPVTPADPRVDQASDKALAALPAEDRFVLAAYFLDGRTLAEIARILKVHESTVSRKLDKLTRNLRATIIKELMANGLDRRAAEEALQVDVRDMAVDIRVRLTQGTAGATFNRRE